MLRGLALSCLLSFAWITPVTLHAELIAHYTFDDADIVGETVKDVSGNGLDGVKMNGGPTTGVAGMLGQAAEFGGGSNNEDNHFVDLSEHAQVFGEITEGTLAAWIRPSTAEEAGGPDGHWTDVLTIFAASDSTQASAEMRWVVHTANSPFSAGGPGGAIVDGSMYLGTRGADFNDHIITDATDRVSLLDGQWHHVAVTVDGDNSGNMFIDGEPVDFYYLNGDAISFMGEILPDGPNTVGIGRNLDSTPGGGQWFYDGLIDDLRVYDQALDAAAIKALFDQAADPLAPLDDGTLTNPQERADYVHNVLRTWIGDSNLDGEFNSGDLVSVFQAGEYEDEQAGNSSWATGDWDGDKEFASGDLVVAFQDGGYEIGPRPQPQAVPEPQGVVTLLLGLSLLANHRRRRHANTL